MSTFNETLEILLSTGMEYERAYSMAESITATRQQTGELSPAEMDIFLILNSAGITGKRGEDMARSINAQRVAAGTTREEEIANRPMPPSSTPPETPVQTPPGTSGPIRNELPYDLGPVGEEDVERLPFTPEQGRQTTPAQTTVPSGRPGTPNPQTEPVQRRTYVLPADEDPEQYEDFFVQIFDRLGSGTTFDAKGDTSELNAWASRLEDTETRMLFAPREYVTRTETRRGDEWNNLVEEAQNAANARRQRVGANIFILELFESLEGADENFVGDSKYDGSGINHADHIFAFNELVFGEQIDMMALARGETINVGDIELSNGYELPDVQLSSLQDYVDLGKRLYENVGEKSIWEIFSRPEEAYEDGVGVVERLKIEYNHLDRVFNDFLGVNSPPARDVFEIPLDWLLLYDDRIDSSEAARDEYQILDTTINQLGSTDPRDVGGGLIRAGYTSELELLEVPVEEDGSVYGPDRDLIEGAQSVVGSVEPPGGYPVSGPGYYGPGDFRPAPPLTGPGYYGPGDFRPAPDDAEIGDGDSFLPVDSAEYDLLKEYLAQNYGGFSFFFELEDQTLNIGLNQYDKPVERNSAEAVRNIHILDYIVGNYTTHDMSGGAGQITDDQLLFEALRATEWYQTTNVSMREWQGGGGVSGKYSLVGGADPMARFQELTLGERQQIVGFFDEESIYKDLVTAAQELMGPGAEDTIGQERLMQLAAEIDYLGYDTDNVELRQRLLNSVINSEQQFQSGTADFSAFRLERDRVDTTARQFYLPITEERRNSYAEKLFTGEMTEADVLAQMRTQAISRYGQSDQVRAALQAGLTMADYFDPYIAEMENILDRPVDLMTEFPEIIEMVSADGVARPMTHAELGEYVRGLPEWGQSDQGQDTARGLVQSIGALFGETA